MTEEQQRFLKEIVDCAKKTVELTERKGTASETLGIWCGWMDHEWGPFERKPKVRVYQGIKKLAEMMGKEPIKAISVIGDEEMTVEIDGVKFTQIGKLDGECVYE